MATLKFGHAGNSAREAFCDAVESYWTDGLAKRAPLAQNERKAITSLWNCTDCLPGDVYDLVCEVVALNGMAPPQRRTYAAASRAIAAASGNT